MDKFLDWLCACACIFILILIGVLGALPVIFIYNYGISVLGLIGIIIYYALYFGTIIYFLPQR